MSNPVSKEMLMNLSRDLISEDNDLLESVSDELGVEPVNLHSYLQEIFLTPPQVAIPIDNIPKDLTEWANTLVFEVKIWELKKYVDSKSGEVLFSVPDDAIPTSDSYSRISSDSSKAGVARAPNETYQEMFEQHLLHDSEEFHMKYGPKSGEKTTFTGIARINGIELDGQVYSPSTAALLCIQKINPDRLSVNGWLSWKNSEGQTINDLSSRLSNDGTPQEN